MMPYIFLIVGLLFIFFEFFVPGGILAIIGGALILLGVVFFAMQATSLLAVIGYALGSLVLLTILILFTLKKIRQGKSIYLNTDQEGYVASSYQKEYVGKKGTALSDLKPADHILVEGKSFQAVSQIGYITKGTPIVIVGGEGSHFIVKEEKLCR